MPKPNSLLSNSLRTRRRPCRPQSGVTLIELLIAAAIFLVFLIAIVGLTVQNQNTFIAQEEIAATQQDTRGALLTMANALLLGGCGVPGLQSDPGGTAQNLAFINADAAAVTFRGCFADPPVRAALNGPVTVPAGLGGVGPFPVDIADAFLANDPIFLFSSNRWAYGTVTAVDTALDQLTVNFTAANIVPNTFGSGSLVYREEIMTFDLNAGVLRRTLTLGGGAAATVPLASNVTALQFTYFDPGGAVPGTPLALADLRQVHGVQIDLTLQTQRRNPQTGQFMTVRLTTAVQPRNMFQN
ncbi:MAG: PilW family protein [Terriglobia bacterium]